MLDRINGRPYATLICAGSDGENAARQIARIATGWRLRAIADPLIVCTRAQTPEAHTCAQEARRKRSRSLQGTGCGDGRRPGHRDLLILRRPGYGDQRGFGKLFRRREVIVAIEVQFVGHRRAAIEFLILLMAATELAADQVPRQLQQRHTPLRGVAGRRDVALELTRRLRIFVVPQRRRQHDHRPAAEVACQIDQPGIDVGLQSHDRIKRDPRRPYDAVLDRRPGFLCLDHDVDDRGQRRHFTELRLTGGQRIDAGDLAVVLHHAEQEFQLRGVADLRLIVPVDV